MGIEVNVKGHKFSLIFGFFILIIFLVGITGINLNGYLEKSLSDVKNNFALSIAIVVFVSYSILAIIFLKDSLIYLSGVITGLGIATFLTGFEYSLGFVVIFYGTRLRYDNETHNKVKNEADKDALKDVRPF